MSLALLLGAVLASAQPSGVTADVGQAQAAAERLQGPLDGRWRLVATGPAAPEMRLVLVDPPDGTPLSGAWTGPGATEPRPIARAERRRDRLRLELAPDAGPPAQVRLTRGRGGWSGVLRQGGRSWPARLVRPTAGP